MSSTGTSAQDHATFAIKGKKSANTNDNHSQSCSRDSVADDASHALETEHYLTPCVSIDAVGAPLSRHVTTNRSTRSQDPCFEVDWEEDDPMNPVNWSTWYKGLVLGVISWGTWVIVVYSTSYTTGFEGMMRDFHISSEPVVTLGITTYLVGLAVGSMILAPISEMYGRRPVYILSMLAFVILVIPCALATSLAEIVVVRFFGAIAASAMMALSPGTIGDITTDNYRALAFSVWSIGPLNGPTFGPILGGFSTQYLGWRFTNWLVMMIGGVAFIALIFLKETYPPVLLQKKAALCRKETGDDRYWSRYDNRGVTLVGLLKVNLKRPFIMIFTEPICIFWDIYVAIIYGILYLCYVAYPIVFTEIRGWSLGMTGLSFIGIGVGCVLTIGLEPYIRRMINAHRKDPSTGRVPPEAMVSVICIAAVLVPVGELWFAWTCEPPIHWTVPIVAGIPFGMGNTAVFIYAANYLAHSYGIYSASAMAGNSVIRSLLGGTVPLAGPSLYRALDPHWAGTLMGLIQFAIIPIPVVFYKYGHKIRMKSAMITQMQQEKERLEKRRARNGGQAKQDEKDHEQATEDIVRVASQAV